jgi:hypothetical protein
MMAIIPRSIMIDGNFWGTIYRFEKAGDVFPIHTHRSDAENHITVVMAGGVRCHGHPDHEGVELNAKEHDYPVVNWRPGEPHGFTALEDGTVIGNFRKVRGGGAEA